jgi:hypothetical protein
VQGEKVYQILYAGEFGSQAYPAGQQLRILAWLHAVAFSPEQLEQLILLSKQVKEEEAAMKIYTTNIGAAEEKELAPIYREIAALYVGGNEVTDEELAPYAKRLEEARARAVGGQDPRMIHYQQVGKTLRQVQEWVATLSPEQEKKIEDCRFFLQRRLGPFTNPGDYGTWLGSAWGSSSFAILKTQTRPENEGQMDIGGLWSADAPEAGGNQTQGLKAAILLLFAVQEEGFVEAVEVRLGRRTPGG